MSYITWNNFTLDSTHPTEVSFTYPNAWEIYFKWSQIFDYLDMRNRWFSFLKSIRIFIWLSLDTYCYIQHKCIWTFVDNTKLWNQCKHLNIRLRITIYDRAWLNKTAETATFIIDSTMPNFFLIQTQTGHDAIWSTTIPTDNLPIRSTGMLAEQIDHSQQTVMDELEQYLYFLKNEYTWYACVMDKAGNVRTKLKSIK